MTGSSLAAAVVPLQSPRRLRRAVVVIAAAAGGDQGEDEGRGQRRNYLAKRGNVRGISILDLLGLR